MSWLVVHADADHHFDAIELVPSTFCAFGKFAEIVDKTVCWLEVAYLVFLGGVVVDYFCAVRGRDAWEVLT